MLQRVGVGVAAFAVFAAAAGLATWSGQSLSPVPSRAAGQSAAAAVVPPSLAAPPLLDGRSLVGQPVQQVAADLSSHGVDVLAQLVVRSDVPTGRITKVIRRGNTVVLQVATAQAPVGSGLLVPAGTVSVAPSGDTLLISTAPPASGTSTTTDPPTVTDGSTPPTTTDPPPTTTTEPPPTTTTTEPPPTI
jgi:hypothetical protein